MAAIPETITKLKTKLLAAMRAGDVKSVEVNYSGSGDDGCIDSVQLNPHPDAANLAKSLGERAEQLAEALIDHYHGGYENNDGGSGVIVVNADSGTIEYERTDYYTESNTEHLEV